MRVTDSLKCLYCHNPLINVDLENNYIECSTCKVSYPVINHIPIIINEEKSIFSFSDFTSQKNLFFDISTKGKIMSRLAKFMPSLGGNNLGADNFNILETELSKFEGKPRVLILGGSIIGNGMEKFVKSERLELLESDVSFGSRTKIVLDAHDIPYEDGSFDAVIVQAVLEHVVDPARCVAEIHRILRNDGYVYAETPFMQQVHGGAYDFTRYSHSGHRYLFKNFTEVKSGPTAGAGTSLAWSYQYFLMALFGFTPRISVLIKIYCRLTGFWLKYFDYLEKWNKNRKDSSSGFYFMGKKSDKTLTNKELIKYYSKL